MKTTIELLRELLEALKIQHEINTHIIGTFGSSLPSDIQWNREDFRRTIRDIDRDLSELGKDESDNQQPTS